MFIIQVLIDAIMRYCLFTYRTGNSNPFLHAFILILNIARTSGHSGDGTTLCHLVTHGDKEVKACISGFFIDFFGTQDRF